MYKIAIIPRCGEAKYAALARAIREAALAEGLKPHARLPAVRKLAQSAGVNPSTVVAALDMLEREGSIYRREGSGTYISPASFSPSPVAQTPLEKRIEGARKVAGAITPVPGGVGPMTIAMLLRNTLEAAKRVG